MGDLLFAGRPLAKCEEEWPWDLAIPALSKYTWGGAAEAQRENVTLLRSRREVMGLDLGPIAINQFFPKVPTQPL